MYSTLFEEAIDKLNIDEIHKSAVKSLYKICMESVFPKKPRDEVRTVQRFLNANGYKLIIDGLIGPKTTRALQKYAKISVDGIFGPITTEAYNKIATQLNISEITQNTETNVNSEPSTPLSSKNESPVSQQSKTIQQSSNNQDNQDNQSKLQNNLLEKYKPGTVVDTGKLTSDELASLFAVLPITKDIANVMSGKSYKGGAPALNTLRYIRCLHVNNNGATIVGELVVNKQIANKVLNIFKELYNAKYPIEKMRLVDYFNANDETSMSANNTSAFNFRYISGSKRISKHGYGMAIDINPLYNPCVSSSGRIEPASGKPYANRSNNFQYKITSNDACCRIFKEYGFKWGGDWKSTKDYQHFEI